MGIVKDEQTNDKIKALNIYYMDGERKKGDCNSDERRCLYI